MIYIKLPAIYDTPIQKALRRDPNAYNLLERSPHYFDLGMRIMWLLFIKHKKGLDLGTTLIPAWQVHCEHVSLLFARLLTSCTTSFIEISMTGTIMIHDHKSEIWNEVISAFICNFVLFHRSGWVKFCEIHAWKRITKTWHFCCTFHSNWRM